MSACLLGKKVRYDGGSLSVHDQLVEKWVSEGRIVSVCPEVEAGMSIPRKPAEIFGGSGNSVLDGEAEVFEKGGDVVTDDFIAGASIALELCKKFNCKIPKRLLTDLKAMKAKKAADTDRQTERI